MPIHLTLRHFAQVIQRKSIYVLLLLTLCTGITYALCLYLPSSYQATVLIEIHPFGQTANGGGIDTQKEVANAVVLSRTSPVIRLACQHVRGITVAQLTTAISAEMVTVAGLIAIHANAATQSLAISEANAVTNALLSFETTHENARLQAQLNQIAQQITSTHQALDNAQGQLTAMQQNPLNAANVSKQQALRDGDQTTYNQLLTNQGELQVQKSQLATLFTIIQSANISARLNSYDPLSSSALIAGISLGGFVLLFLLLDWLDSDISTNDDVQQQTTLAPLGQLPFIRNFRRGAQLLDFSQPQMDPLREAFILLKNALALQVQAEGQPRVLLCTSLRKGSGTSTVAAQLAIVLAQSGTRVLLIDTHTQRAMLHQILQMPRTSSISASFYEIEQSTQQPEAYLANWLAQHKTFVPNLWLLSIGSAGTVPGGLVSHIPQIAQLQSQLLGLGATQPARPIIDLIILDTPPMLEGSITQALTLIADASLLVITAAQESPEAVNRAGATLQRLKAPVLGVIINKCRPRHRPYFYIGRYNHNHQATRQRSTQSKTDKMQKLTETAELTELTAAQMQTELPETPLPQPLNAQLLQRQRTNSQMIQPRLSLPTSLTGATLHTPSLIKNKNIRNEADIDTAYHTTPITTPIQNREQLT